MPPEFPLIVSFLKLDGTFTKRDIRTFLDEVLQQQKVQVVVFLIKPISFLPFSMPSPSSSLKLPDKADSSLKENEYTW